MKKLLTVILVLISTGSFIFAGGSQEETTAPTESSAPTVVRIQGYGGQDPAVVVKLLDEVIGKQLVDENIELVYEPLEGDYNMGIFNGLSAGTAGDIFYIPVESAPGIIATGQVLPLNGKVATDDYIDSLIDAYTVEGNIYGIPKDFNTLAIYYNKDLFDEAGIEYPTDDETWTSLSEKARAISAIDDDVYGIAFQPGWDRFGAFAYGTGWNQFEEDGKTNLLDPKFVKAFTWYTDLIAEGAAVVPSDIGQGWTGGAFATEQVGMAVEGSWMIGFLNNDAPNIPYGTIKIPTADGGQKGNFLYTVAYGVNKNTEDIDAAIRVLELLTGEEAQRYILENGLAIPSRKSLSDDPFFSKGTKESEANKTVFEGSADGYVYGFQFGSVGMDWMQPVNSAMSSVTSGQATVTEALETAQQEMDLLFK